MPYLSLGKTNMNYSDERIDKFIVTMILDTSSSYQYPVLVRDTPTLDIYFGKSFKYRDFLNELLGLGVTLYLYRPIQELAPTKSWADELEELRSEVGEEFIPEYEYLPSNFVIPENSPSWVNRDSIRIFNSDQHNGFSFNYCYPQYNKDYKKYREDGSSYIIGLGGAENNISNYKLDEGYETLAFNLDFSNVSIDDFKPGEYGSRYIVIPYLGYNYMLWFSYNGSSVPSEMTNIRSDMRIDIDNLSKEDLILKITDILTNQYSISEPYGLGYEVVKSSANGDSITISKKRTSSTYNIEDINVNIQLPEKNYKYFDLPNLVYESDFRRTNDILSEATESIKQLEFYSKTIGKGEDDIKVSIERIENGNYEYKIIISRHDYEEYYEVNISDTYGNSIAPLAGTINKNSKLVTCKLYDRITSLPEGEFYLRGSWTEEYTHEERKQSLDIIKETDIYDDVLIIDDLELWKSDATITKEDLKLFLDYSIYKDNQTYITNRSYRSVDPSTGGYNVYHEHRYNITDKDKWVRGLLTVRNDLFCNIDVILNVGDLMEMISDKQNRLVYFYNDMSLIDSYRPGCYTFLKGILTDDYSVESTNIQYTVPNDNILDELRENKSNYMLYNNSYYYYPRYQNGDLSKVTTVTRFIISKIGREFRRNKWKIINSTVHERNREIRTIISNTLYSYSIIKSLEVTNMTQEGNNLHISVESKINELVVKNITININLNYN